MTNEIQVYTARAIEVSATNGSELIQCGRCKGTGENNFEHFCRVCKGIGKVIMASPYVKCDRCKGTGENNFEHFCRVCKGVGVVPYGAIKNYSNT